MKNHLVDFQEDYKESYLMQSKHLNAGVRVEFPNAFYQVVRSVSDNRCQGVLQSHLKSLGQAVDGLQLETLEHLRFGEQLFRTHCQSGCWTMPVLFVLRYIITKQGSLQ